MLETTLTVTLWILGPVVTGLIVWLIVAKFIEFPARKRETTEREEREKEKARKLDDIWNAVRPNFDRKLAEDQGQHVEPFGIQGIRKDAREALLVLIDGKFDRALHDLKAGKTEKAEKVLCEIQVIAAGSGDLQNAACAARRRGAIAFLSDTHRAIEAYEQAVKYNSDDPIGWNQLGRLKRRIGDLAGAVEAFENVRASGEEKNDKRILAIALGNLGIISKIRGDFDSANEFYISSLNIAHQLKDVELKATALISLGVIAMTRGDLDVAENDFEKANAIAKKLKSKDLEVYILGNLGMLWQFRGNIQLAEDYYKKSLAIATKLGKKDSIVRLLGNIGGIAYGQGNFEVALKYAMKSISISKEMDNKEALAKQLVNIGSLFVQKGELTVGIKYWCQARDLFVQIGMPHMVEMVKDRLIDLGNRGSEAESESSSQEENENPREG